MKSCNSMSLSFTMLVGLYVSAYKNLRPCIDFHGIFLLGSLLKSIVFSFCSSATIIDTPLKTYMNI